MQCWDGDDDKDHDTPPERMSLVEAYVTARWFGYSRLASLYLGIKHMLGLKVYFTKSGRHGKT